MTLPPIKADTGLTTANANGYVKTDILQKLNGDSWLDGYATTSAVAAAYLPLTGGIVTGDLSALGGTLQLGTGAVPGHIDLWEPTDDINIEIDAIQGGIQVGGKITAVGRVTAETITLSSGALTLHSTGIIAGAATVSATEVSYLDGVTSAIQTQLDGKLATSTAASTYLPLAGGTITGPLTGTSNILEQRNSTNAQTLRVYGSYTDASTYSRASLSCSTTAVTLAFESNTGNGDIVLTPKGTGIVSSAASIFTSGNFQGSVGTAIQWGTNATRAYISAPSVGKLLISNTTNYNGVTLDANTTDTLKVRNGADNADGAFFAGAGTFSGTVESATSVYTFARLQAYSSSSCLHLQDGAGRNFTITSGQNAQQSLSLADGRPHIGVEAGPYLSFNGGTGSQQNSLNFVVTSGRHFFFNGGNIRIGDSTTPTQKLDVGGNAVLRNSTTATYLHVHGTYTDASTYVRASLSCSTTAVTLAAEDAGSSGNLNIVLTPKGTGSVFTDRYATGTDTLIANKQHFTYSLSSASNYAATTVNQFNYYVIGPASTGTNTGNNNTNQYNQSKQSGGTGGIDLLYVQRNVFESAGGSTAYGSVIASSSEVAVYGGTSTYTSITNIRAVAPATTSHSGTIGTYTGIESTNLVGTNITTAYAARLRMDTATGRWNLYADGTAQNYFAGGVSIGTTTATSAGNLLVNGAGTFNGQLQANNLDLAPGRQILRCAIVSNDLATGIVLTSYNGNLVEQRNSTNAQTFRVYGTYTDASTYVRASLSCSTTAVTLAAESAGGGANLDVNINPKGTGTLIVNNNFQVLYASTSSIRAEDQGTYPRLYFGGSSTSVAGVLRRTQSAASIYFGEDSDTGGTVCRGAGGFQASGLVTSGEFVTLFKNTATNATTNYCVIALGPHIGYTVASAPYIGSYNNSNDAGLVFGTYSGSRQERMRITDTGNVGINETSPDYKLDVNGTFGFTPGSSVTPVDNGDVVIEATSNTSLTFKLKGSDGTVRTGTVTLA